MQRGGENGGTPDAKRSTREVLRTARTTATEAVAGTRERLESMRPHSTAVDSVFRAIERDTETGGGVLAGAVAFRVFLFQVPYVFFLVVTLGVAASSTETDPTDLARSAGVGGLTARAVASAASITGWNRLFAIAVSGLALFLAARAAVKVLRIVHILIWRVPYERIRRSSRAAAGFILLVTIALALSALVGWLRSQSLVAGLVGIVLYLVVPFGLWLLVSWWLPHADCPWWALAPGAALFAIGVEVLHVVTVYWIAHLVSSKSQTYGAIGSALALLLWAYLLGRLISTSAVLNATLWYHSQVRHGHGVPAELDLGRAIPQTPEHEAPEGSTAPES